MGVACSRLSGKDKQNEKRRQEKKIGKKLHVLCFNRVHFKIIEKQECPGLKSILYPQLSDHSLFGQECGPRVFIKNSSSRRKV